MKYELKTLDDKTIDELIKLSKRWEQEECTWGIIANSKQDIKEPLFVAIENDIIIGYIFGHFYTTESKTSYIEVGSKCFMIDEIYVLPTYRNRGIGKKLFKLMEEHIKISCDYITLSTSTKNYKSILHFYIDELDMCFHSAFLIKDFNG